MNLNQNYFISEKLWVVIITLSISLGHWLELGPSLKLRDPVTSGYFKEFS